MSYAREKQKAMTTASAQWRADGFFSESRADGVRVKGVASDAEAVAELLRRVGVLAAPSLVYRARPDDEVRDYAWSPEASAEAGDVGAEIEHQLTTGPPAGMMPCLEALGRALPGSRQELALVAQEQAKTLNQHVPQVGSHRLFMPPSDESEAGALGVRGSAVRGWAKWAEWVESRLLVSTNSPESISSVGP
jgi:hypothetical protein